jgi:selenide,water dikinase
VAGRDEGSVSDASARFDTVKLPVFPHTRIVLVGGGHAHVAVLHAFAMQPEPGVVLTVVAKEVDAPYSGMLPGFVAGHYTHEECHIDVLRLARAAGARVVHGEVTGIDRAHRQVTIAGRAVPLGYDHLSLDTGITPLLDGIAGAAEHAIAVKPVSSFAPRWHALEARALTKDGPRRIAVVGTGAAGLELILAIAHRLREQARSRGLDPAGFAFVLVGSADLLPTHNPRARALARAALAEAGVELVGGDAAVAVDPTGLMLASGRRIAAEAVLVTTKAAPPAWFRATGLPLDPAGFIAVRPTLQVLDDDRIFAVGDCASVLEHPREKAGVFAVRQGAPLTENLRRCVRGERARPFTPQRRFLTILSLGDRRAIAARGAFAVSGRWVWRWKDRIDRAFMERHNQPPGMSGAGARRGGETAGRGGTAADAAEEAMRCLGCAAKVGPQPLARAMARLRELPSLAEAGRGKDLAPDEDAALLDTGGPELRVESIDFFPAFWPEPHVLGEIAAAHALSDVFAMGGTPAHALAVVALPPAAPALLEDDLVQLLAGARAALERDGVALIGGHTSEAPEPAIGFSVSGAVPRGRVLLKRGLRPGDRLVLTKPLGTGLLLAAWMRGKARAPDLMAAIESMRRSNATAARVLLAHGATAATDVTGFGLGGHLLGMLEASGVAARLDWGAIPLLAGARELAAAGIASSIVPANREHVAPHLSGRILGEAELALLLDPQTSGGLLAGLPAERAEACLAELRAAGETSAALVGHVEATALGEATAPGQAGGRLAVA